jgi:hypothetical protein
MWHPKTLHPGTKRDHIVLFFSIPADIEVEKQLLVFGLTANDRWCRSSDLTLMVAEPFSWVRRRLHLIYGSRLFILKDTGRSDSWGEHRLCYRSARTRTLDVSIVTNSRGPSGPDGPAPPYRSITYICRRWSAAFISIACFVIWKLFPTMLYCTLNYIKVVVVKKMIDILER